MNLPAKFRCLVIAGLLAAAPAGAQISFTSAVGLALRNSPRVRMAQADVDHALANLALSRDVYIPSVMGTSALGASYSVPLTVPTIFSFSAQSLVFSDSQRDYIRAARAALVAANLTLKDVRQQVAEDAAITYISLDQAQQQQQALGEESGDASQLVSIVQQRLDAGQDTRLGLLQSQRTAAQLRLQQIQLEDDAATQRDHLGRLIGLPAEDLTTVSSSVPASTAFAAPVDTAYRDTPAVQASYANAHAKWEQAFGDARFAWRPQVEFVADYSRISPFNNVATYYGDRENPNVPFNYNAIGIGIQIQVPFFDPGRKARARETWADAEHAQSEATIARDQQLEARLKLKHTVAELTAQGNLAEIDQQIAQQQLDAVSAELQSGTGGTGAQMSPKDEETARITERQRYLDLLDARVKLVRTEITLLRQTGELEDWLKSLALDLSTPAKH